MQEDHQGFLLQYSQPSREPNQETIDSLVGEFQSRFSDLVDRYLPRVSAIPIFQGMTWVPTWKATPNCKVGVPDPKSC